MARTGWIFEGAIVLCHRIPLIVANLPCVDAKGFGGSAFVLPFRKSGVPASVTYLYAQVYGHGWKKFGECRKVSRYFHGCGLMVVTYPSYELPPGREGTPAAGYFIKKIFRVVYLFLE